MSVKVSVYGGDKDSDEYNAALKLKKIIQDSIPNSADGEIVLYASATLYGQVVKDVDIIMLGSLKGYSVTADFYDRTTDGTVEKKREIVEIESFSTVIEVKRHDISRILTKGTDIYVKYGENLHNVTLQSNKQKYSAMSFFESVHKSSPFITNIIWFTQATPDEIKGLLSVDGKNMPSNVLGADFVFGEMVQELIMQKDPNKVGKRYVFNANYGECSIGEFQKALSLLTRSKEQMGELTRKKIEMISNKALGSSILVDAKDKVSVYRGRAGTGKTIGLIQTAIHLVDEKQMRVLILTYNKALVFDIRRMFALADLPDMFEDKCVFVNTLDSYFLRLAKVVLYDNKLEWEEYNEKYEDILKELKDLMSDEDGIALVRDSISQNEYLDWDYLLIDEAQDWIDAERDVVLKLFDKGHIIIADGGNQFVRRSKVCDWSVVRERNNIPLKICLRQKENLISFLNVYTDKSEVNANRIIGSGKLFGGKVIITSDDHIIDIHKQEMEALKKNGNIAYDMLYLVPHELVDKEDTCSKPGFILKDKFEAEGISIWDGTLWEIRNSYSISNDEIRVLQYDSARGLEGWAVVCLDFDVFLEEKLEEYKEYPEEEEGSLLLESPEDRKRKYLYNWAMIPLTRAIDTLVITLKDPDSEVGELLREIAGECEDYVSMVGS